MKEASYETRICYVGNGRNDPVPGCCSAAPPNTGSSAADSSIDESTDSPGDTSQYNNDADGDSEYTDNITYNPSRDYVTGDNYTPIMDVETSTWGGSSDIDMGDMVSYCLSDITYGIDDGYSDGFYVVTISGTLKGGLAPYLTSVQGGQAAWLDVKISYHNDVFSCKVNNQSKVSNDGLTITNYMIDCYRQHLQDDTQAQADQEEQQTIEANRFSDLSVDQQKQCIGWGASADDTMVMHYDDMYTSDQNFAKFADYVLAHYNDYTIDTEDGKTIHAAVINNSDGAYGGEYVVMVPDDQLPVGDKSLYVTMSLDGYREYKNYGYDDNQPFMYYGIWQHPKKCLDKIETVNDMYYGEYMAGYGGINTGFYFRPESSVKAQLVTSWCAFDNCNRVTPESNQLIDARMSQDAIF